MVGNVMSLTNNGLKDWLIQRVTAVVLALYVIMLGVFCLWHAPVGFEVWRHLFQSVFMRIFTILALLSLGFHVWIGMWTVTTDYLKSALIRTSINIAIILVLIGYFIWGNIIVWSI